MSYDKSENYENKFSGCESRKNNNVVTHSVQNHDGSKENMLVEPNDNTPTSMRIESLLGSDVIMGESLQPIVADSASTGMSETTLQDMNQEDVRRMMDAALAVWNKPRSQRMWGWFAPPQFDAPLPKTVKVLGADEILEGFNGHTSGRKAR